LRLLVLKIQIQVLPEYFHKPFFVSSKTRTEIVYANPEVYLRHCILSEEALIYAGLEFLQHKLSWFLSSHTNGVDSVDIGGSKVPKLIHRPKLILIPSL